MCTPLPRQGESGWGRVAGMMEKVLGVPVPVAGQEAR